MNTEMIVAAIFTVAAGGWLWVFIGRCIRKWEAEAQLNASARLFIHEMRVDQARYMTRQIEDWRAKGLILDPPDPCEEVESWIEQERRTR